MHASEGEGKKRGLGRRIFMLLLWLVALLICARLAALPFWTYYNIPHTGSAGSYPTLLGGDYIAVKKHYGEVRRGDLMAFRYNDDLASGRVSVARVAAVAGDTMEYADKHLRINQAEQPQEAAGEFVYVDNLQFVPTKRYIEDLNGHRHALLLMPDRPSLNAERVGVFSGRDYCTYDNDVVKCRVPDGQYFMLGDNRDASADSRYRGFVPQAQIIGRITRVWMNFDDSKRIGLVTE